MLLVFFEFYLPAIVLAKSCTAKEVNHPYYLCSKIIEEADISSWFLEAEGKFRVKWQQQKLVAATDILIITRLPDKTISLPDLTTVKREVFIAFF